MSAPTTISDIRLLVVYHHGVEFLTVALEAALESARVARRSQSRLSIGISVMLNGISSQTHAAAASIASLQQKIIRGDSIESLQIIRNEVRTQYSGGFLARDWNSALMLAFGTLTSPECKLAILMQHDCVLRPSFFVSAWELHESFDFVAYGRGDELHSYTPRAVTRIGMWDERYVGFGWSEGDYFMRAIAALGPRASISDAFHRRVYQPMPEAMLNAKYLNLNASTGFERKATDKVEAVEYALGTRFTAPMTRFHTHKWGLDFNKCYDACIITKDRGQDKSRCKTCDERSSNPFWCQNMTALPGKSGSCHYSQSTQAGCLGAWNATRRKWSMASGVPHPKIPYVCTYPEFDTYGCKGCLSGFCPERTMHAEMKAKRQGKAFHYVTDVE